MQYSILILVLLFSPSICYCQTREIIYSNSKDTTANYYITYKPSGKANGLLLLLVGFGETPQSAAMETGIHTVAIAKGLVTVFASLQRGNISFYIDSLSQTSLDKLIPQLQKKYSTKGKPFYLGGFSLGGSGAVRYAERAYASKDMLKPNAVFAIDPPLDFERVFDSDEFAVRYGKNEVAVNEAGYFSKRVQYEFQSTPQTDITTFRIFSPYSRSDTTQTNIKPLLHCPIRLICEPDIAWQLENRNRSLYDLNALDCSALINILTLWGNQSAVLTITMNKGYRRSTGKRNPHSWSIADSNDVIDWLLKY